MLNSKLAVVVKLLAAQAKASGKVENFSFEENGESISIGLIELSYSVKDLDITASGAGKPDAALPDEGKFSGKVSNITHLLVRDVKVTQPKRGLELNIELIEFDSLSEGVEFLVDLASK